MTQQQKKREGVLIRNYIPGTFCQVPMIKHAYDMRDLYMHLPEI